MKRKRNIYFGFLPAHPTKKELMASRKAFKASVRQKTKEVRAEYSRLRKSARSGRTASTRKLEQLFHEVYGPGGMVQNPRELPGMNAMQMQAIQRLIEGKAAMAQKKKRSKKKRNGRKGVMPAGLKAYWAKKRASKAKRKNPRKKRRNPKTRTRTRTVIKWRTRTVKVRPKRRRRKSNPRRAAKASRIVAPRGLTGKGLQQFRSTVARLTGKRTRLVYR